MKERIRPSEDSKTKFSERERNTFGTLPGPQGTCPCATCGPGGCWTEDGMHVACYAHRFMQFRPSIRGNLEHNTRLLKACSGKERVELLKEEFLRFRYGDGGRYYRLHWSGDIFSAAYARDLMRACEAVPDVKFWNFTRNFRKDVVQQLVSNMPENVVQYVSADAVNLEEAVATTKAWPTLLKFSYMGHEPPAGIKLYACPANSHSKPVEFMCKNCRMCLKGLPVFFRTRGQKRQTENKENK